MELSNPLQADILHIQEQLKSAIQKHQLLVTKLRVDTENVEVKKELGELQRYIMNLGANQKRLLQELRNKLDAGDSSDSTLKKSDSEGSVDSTSSPPPAVSEVTDASPNKKARLESPAPSPARKPGRPRSKSTTPEPRDELRPPTTPSPHKTPSRASSPQASNGESCKKEVRSSPSTRSTRSLSLCTPMRGCSPVFKQEPLDPLETPNGNLEAALSSEGSEEERKLWFLACISLITPELTVELQRRRELRKHKPSAMNPFIIFPSVDISQKRRRETYLQNPRTSRADDSPERECSSPVQEGRVTEDEAASVCGEQLFTEHRLDQLAEQPTPAGNECSKQQALVAERDRLREIQHQLQLKKMVLEQTKETLARSLQEQSERKAKLLEKVEKTRQSVAHVHNFLSHFKDMPVAPPSALPSLPPIASPPLLFS